MATTGRQGGTARTTRRTASSRAGHSASARPAASRPAVRPAAAARGRRPAGEQRPPRSLTRMAILAAIFVMLAVTLVPTLRSTLNQRRQISDLRGQLAQQGRTVAALQQEQRQWNDPAYVEQQARERLKFVRVGETSYTVIDAEAPPADTGGGPKIAAPVQASAADNPWYGQLWQSMVIADAPAKAPAKAPATVAPARARPSTATTSAR